MLPLILTIGLLAWLVHLVTAPFKTLAGTGVVLTLLLGAIVFLGFVGERLLTRLIVRSLKRVPIIGKLYRLLSDMIDLVLSPKGQSFSEVVWVPFWDNRLVIGLVAHENEDKVSVFIPGALNSAFGFVVLVDRSLLLPCHVSVEEAIRYQVSCGMIGSPGIFLSEARPCLTLIHRP